MCIIATYLAWNALAAGLAWSDDSPPGHECDISATVSTCFGDRNGTIDVNVNSTSRDDSPRTAPPDPRVAAVVAACLDARAEAVAQGVPIPPQVEAVCGGVPAVTQEMVLRAFRELPLYRGVIHTDPQGWTLVNLDTYFWCADAAGRSCAAIGEAEQSVTLLGRPVRVRPRIASYTWSLGDGSELAGTGGTGRVAHVYRTPAVAPVRVTLTWTADFAVAGQPFQPIAGTTTTTSPPLPLVVRSARPVLVGGD